MSAILKSVVKEVMTSIGLRVSETERAIIEAKAKKFTKGNVSEWVRYAAINMQPKKEDVTNDIEKSV